MINRRGRAGPGTIVVVGKVVDISPYSDAGHYCAGGAETCVSSGDCVGLVRGVDVLSLPLPLSLSLSLSTSHALSVT